MPAVIIPALAGALGGTVVATAIASAIVYGTLAVGAYYLQTLFSKKTPSAAKPSEMKTVIKEATAARRRSYGLTMVGGTMVMLEESGALLSMVIATGQGQINRIVKHYIDGREVTFTTLASGVNKASSEPYNIGNRLYMTQTLGETDPPRHSYVMGNFGWAWTSSHIGRGVPSVGLVFSRPSASIFSSVYPNGPRIEYRQLREGALVYDPRTKTTGYSDNAALCIRDFLISEYGMRLPSKFVEAADRYWIEAANICDELVPLKAGGYEKRYRIAMTYQLDERPVDVVKRMLAACDAEFFLTPDCGLTIVVGKWKAPTITLDDDAITGIDSLSRGADVLNRYNTLRAQYTSPDHNFEEVDADPWIDATSVGLYGEITQDVQLYEIPSHSQARRIMKRAFSVLTAGWRLSITTNLSGLAVMGQRFIRVRLSEFGINQSFEVQGQPQFILGDNGAIIGTKIDLIAMSARAFSWNPSTEEGTAAGVNANTAPAFVMPIPTGLSVTREDRTLNGAVFTWALMNADIPSDANIIRYEVSMDNGKNWQSILGHSDTMKAEYGPLSDDIVYQVRARTVTAAETAESEATEILTITSEVSE